MRITRRALPAVAVALTSLLLAACGTTEDAATSTTASPAASSGPVDITDERGTVHLDAPAKNVVSLEWGLTENLVALGVKPVGEADTKGYNTWDSSAPIDASTPDVGQRGEPSLDAIVALHPDLVVTTTDLSETVIAQLAKQVPVLALKGSDGTDAIGYMKRTVNTLAQVTGTQTQAAKLLADFDAKITSAKASLATAGKSGAPFTMSDGWVDSGTVTVRMYTPTSFFGAIAAQLGLQNQWTTGGDKDYGLATTDVEGLTKVTNADSTFIYVGNKTDGGDFTDSLKSNAVWKQTPWVKANKVKRIPDGIWMFGGPIAASAYVDALVSALSA